MSTKQDFADRSWIHGRPPKQVPPPPLRERQEAARKALEKAGKWIGCRATKTPAATGFGPKWDWREY